MISWTPTKGTPEQKARKLFSVVQHIHATYKDEVWLWRGEKEKYPTVQTGIHQRVLNDTSPGSSLSEQVTSRTKQLIDDARQAGLGYSQKDTELASLQLLARLQHYGAATPLLDVSVDPLIAFWMAVFAGDGSEATEGDGDGKDGRIMGFLRPSGARTIPPSSEKSFHEFTDSSLHGYYWYNPPFVAERLRIQRGSFLIGPLAKGHEETSLDINTGNVNSNFIRRRIENMGSQGKPASRTAEMFSITIPKKTKSELRNLLKNRSGLDRSTVYPIPASDRPLEYFATNNGRSELFAKSVGS